nr:Chain C, Nucleoprotein [Severe acute respiratory syndrome coronavirus 2]
ALNTPKDHI